MSHHKLLTWRWRYIINQCHFFQSPLASIKHLPDDLCIFSPSVVISVISWRKNVFLIMALILQTVIAAREMFNGGEKRLDKKTLVDNIPTMPYFSIQYTCRMHTGLITSGLAITAHIMGNLINIVASLTKMVRRYWSKFNHVRCNILQCHIASMWHWNMSH